MSMRFRVLDAGTADGLAAWNSIWCASAGREPMAHPEYALLFARPSDRAVCATAEDGDRRILFPLLLRPLATEPWATAGEERCDATSPYGYGGPYAFGEAPRKDDMSFWSAHAAWCRANRVISTFVRLSLFPQDLAPIPWPIMDGGPNIVCALDGGIEAVTRGYDRAIRKNLGTARRHGVTTEVDLTGARLDEFLAVYTHTMERRRASPWYFFPRAFFEGLVARLPGQFAFVHALHAGKVVSSELVLVSPARVYSFLGGTLAWAYSLRPNDLLRHHIIAWAIAAGKTAYVLGGGYARDDGIFQHKRNVAPRGEVPFRVATAVHDEDAYYQLVRARAAFEARQGNSWNPRPGCFFPTYRA